MNIKKIVIAGVLAIGISHYQLVADDGDIKSIEVRGNPMQNADVQSEVDILKKAGNINNVDFKKMQEDNCNLVVRPMDGSDFKHGAYWQDKDTCERHYSTIVPSKKALGMGIYNGSWARINKSSDVDKIYADTKLTIKRSNKCFFLGKEIVKNDGGLKRNKWKVVGDRTVELHTGLYLDKGEFLLLKGTDSKKEAWNVFNSPLNCSETPSSEEWTVHQKVNGRWVQTGHAKFYIQK